MTSQITNAMLVRIPGPGPEAHPTPPAGQAVTHRFPGHAQSVGRARAALRHQLALWHIDADAAESAALLLSELATHAVNATSAHTTRSRDIHGAQGTQGAQDTRYISVRFELDGRRLRLEVSDTSDEQPVRQLAADEDVRGRGLALVDALADGWGVEPRGAAGKAV